MIAMNEYPREEELKIIEEWDFLNKPAVIEFLDYVRNLWKYDDRFVLTGKRILRLYLSTGGWSGNESIINALQKNFIFWTMCWVKHQRGGHYWFCINLKQFRPQIPAKEGNPIGCGGDS